MRAAWLLALLPALAGAQWHLTFPTQAACAAAAASIAGPAGGTFACTTTSTKTITIAAQGVNPKDLGARCDGSSDDAAALTAAIASAKAKGLPVLLPAATCAYGAVLTLDGVKMVGRGDASILWALNPAAEAIFMRGSGPELRSVKLAGVKATVRAPAWEGTRIALFGASSFVIDNVTIDGSTGAGIQTAQATTGGVISNNRVSNTLADGIHLTGKASQILVVGNTVAGTGDDGIAVVSYQGDGGPTHHITAVRNTVSGNKGGRGMSVVGGADVLYEQNRVSNTGAYACLYLAQEDGWKTLADARVVARYNTLSNCGSPATGHGAVMLFAESSANSDITLQRNDVVQNGQAGIRVFGLNVGVTVDSNRISGAVPALQLPASVTATPYVSGAVGAQ